MQISGDKFTRKSPRAFPRRSEAKFWRCHNISVGGVASSDTSAASISGGLEINEEQG